jgi:polyisoprenoid-binding protein YceI
MPPIRKIHCALLFAVLALFVLPARAQWSLVNEASELHFISIKKTSVAEIHRFRKLVGEVDAMGTIRLTIDLASVDTGVPVRDERLQTLLFEVAQFPVALFEGHADTGTLARLEPGMSTDLDVAGKLTLHGHSQEVKAALRVTALTQDRLLVTTRAPILLNADAFGLAAGIEKLREIVGLPSISAAVPVTFSLTLHRTSR